jgi:hypothetical protein
MTILLYLFYPKEGGIRVPQNIAGIILPNNTASHTTGLEFSATLLSKFQISQ